MSKYGRLPKAQATVESYGQQDTIDAHCGWRVKRKKTDRPLELNSHVAAANSLSEQIDADGLHWQSRSTAESAARYPEAKQSSNSLVTATRPNSASQNSASQSRSRKNRTIWRLASMSATVAVVLLVAIGLRQEPDGEVFAGIMNRLSMQLTGSTLKSKPPFSYAESEFNQRVRSRRATQLTSSSRAEASNDVASFDVTTSATITPTYESQHKLTIEIKLPEPAEQPVQLMYMTLDQTAEADQDYVARDGLLTIQPGAAAVQLDIPLIDDAEIEPNETFELMLSLVSEQATPSAEFLVVTILDDDLTTEDDAVERPYRLDRRLPDTIHVNETRSVSIDQPPSISKAFFLSEQAPRLPAAEASPSSTPSSSQETEQVETTLQTLGQRSLGTAQPLQPYGSSTMPGKAQATRSDGSTPDELRQGDAVLSTWTATIDQSDLRTEASPAMLDHRFRVQIAAMRNKADAHYTWNKLQSTLGPMMANMTAYFEQAKTTNGILYQVQIGQFQIRDKAQDLCARLKERDVDCFVVDR